MNLTPGHNHENPSTVTHLMLVFRSDCPNVFLTPQILQSNTSNCQSWFNRNRTYSIMATINSSDIFFNGLLENRASKWIALSFSSLVVICFAPLFYAMVWYEKYGNNNKKTLVDLLLSLLLQKSVFYLVIIKTGDILTYAIGNLPHFICFGHVLLKEFF